MKQGGTEGGKGGLQKDNRKDQSQRRWRAVPGQEWSGKAERQGASSLTLTHAQWDSGCDGGGEDRKKMTGEEGARSIKILSVHNTKCQGL